MLDERLRRWPNVEPTLAECTMFKKKLSCQYTLLGQLLRNPPVITSGSLQAQHPAKSQSC